MLRHRRHRRRRRPAVRIARGRCGGLVRRLSNAFPREAVEIYNLVLAKRSTKRGTCYRHLVALFRWDSRVEFVQAIKLTMDIVGASYGGADATAARTVERDERSQGTCRRETRTRLSRAARTRELIVRASRIINAVDSHTEGMPTRVVTGGVGEIAGATMNDKRLYFMEHLDDLRELLVNEPRGHAAMSGAILMAPTREDADWGVLFIEVSGCLPMCGHGAIGVATVLVETGMVEVTEPVTTVRLDTPAGLVVARVAVSNGHADSVTLENVPSYAVRWTGHWRWRVSVACPTASPSAATSTPWSISTTWASSSTKSSARDHRRGTRHHGGDQHDQSAASPRDRGSRPLPSRGVHRAGFDGPSLASRDVDLPRLV